jgi:hypothetical protein
MLGGRVQHAKNRASTVNRNQWTLAFACVKRDGLVMVATSSVLATVNGTVTVRALARTQRVSEVMSAKLPDARVRMVKIALGMVNAIVL